MRRMRSPLRPTLVLTLLLCSVTLNSTAAQVVDQIVAIVGDEIVLRSEVEQFAQVAAAQLGISLRTNPRRVQQLWNESLQGLIDQKILLNRAEEDSVVVSDRDVDAALDQQIESIIQRAGSKDEVERLLGYPVRRLRRDYRDEVKKRLLVERIQSEKFRDTSVSRREVELFFATYEDSIPPLKEAAEVSHILLEVNPGEEALRAARDRIDRIHVEVLAGADFATVAREKSDDPGSAPSGGELGLIERGSLVRPFEEIAYSLAPGEVSGVVETGFGFHIIKMIERRGERINVRHILAVPVASDKDEDRTRLELRQVRTRILEGEEFETAALDFSDDPEVQFNRGDLGWLELDALSIPQFREVIDSIQVGKISLPFRTPFGYHILRLNDRRAAGHVTLDEHWAEIENLALIQKRNRVYRNWLSSLREEIYIEIKI